MTVSESAGEQAALKWLSSSAEVIAELIKLAEEMREAQKRGEKLGLTEDEVAFYDALEVNDSAVKVHGDEYVPKRAKVDKIRNYDKINTQEPKWRNWQTRYVQGVVSLRS